MNNIRVGQRAPLPPMRGGGSGSLERGAGGLACTPRNPKPFSNSLLSHTHSLSVSYSHSHSLSLSRLISSLSRTTA